MIADKANKMFVGQEIINAKGQITNMEKFNEALVALMEEKYAGGMEKMSKTTKGMWSTVTGVTKSGLATLVGMSADGSVRAGSALDFVRQKVGELATRFEQWQNDGTIDRIAVQFDGGVKRIGDVLNWLFNAVQKGIPIFVAFSPIIKGVVAGIASFKVINGAVKGFKLLRAAVLMLKVPLMTSPIFLIAAAIAGIITLLDYLGVDWKAVFKGIIDWVKKAWDWIKKLWDRFGEFASAFVGMNTPPWLQVTIALLKETYDWLTKLQRQAAEGLGGKTSIGGAGGATGGSAGGGTRGGSMPGHATGTPYYPGGWTRINEGGRDEAAFLPSGTMIIPNSALPQLAGAGGPNIELNVIIQGNVIGNRQYVDYMGGEIVRRLLNAMKNR